MARQVGGAMSPAARPLDELDGIAARREPAAASPEACIGMLTSEGDEIDLRSAVYQQVRGALEEMLEWKTGRFLFRRLGESSFPEVASEVAIDTPVVLLEACTDLDNKNRGAIS